MYQRKDTKIADDSGNEGFELSQFGQNAAGMGESENDALVGGVRRSKRRRRFNFQDDSWLNEKVVTGLTICALLTMTIVTVIYSNFASLEQRGERCVAVTPYLGDAVSENSSWCSHYDLRWIPMNGRHWHLKAERKQVAFIIASYVTVDGGNDILLSIENIRGDYPHAEIVVSDLGSPVQDWQTAAVDEHGVRLVREASGKNELAGYRAGLAVVGEADLYVFMQATYVYNKDFLETVRARRCSIITPSYTVPRAAAPFDTEEQQAWVQDKLSRMKGGCPEGYYLPETWTRLYAMTFAATEGAVRDLYCRGVFHAAEGENNVPAGAQERLLGILMEHYGAPGASCNLDGISVRLPPALDHAPKSEDEVGLWKKYHFWKVQGNGSI